MFLNPDILLLAAVAGGMIPLGAWLARIEHIQPRWLEPEVRHSIVALGGGALLAAVALVLVPHGVEHLSLPWATLCFFGGGLVFAGLDQWLSRSGGSLAQFMAMLADFIPESLALGALASSGGSNVKLLAVLIAVQNLPEGFNAYREVLHGHRLQSGGVLLVFALIAALGPLVALVGMAWLAESMAVTAGIMLFAAGGILFLTFQDIAPQARLKYHRFPALASLLGFFIGLAGHMLGG